MERLSDIVQQGQSGGNGVTSKHFTQGYNALSQKTNIARYQSTGTTNAVATTDYTYDTANRLSGIAHKQGATNLNTYSYAYDGLSRFTTITSTAEGTDTFSYDATSQVTGATHTSQSNETYGFDLNGNRNTSGYTVATNNQTTAGQGFTYTYDNEGNRTLRTETATGKLQTYEWDYRNRLVRVTEKASVSGALTKEILYSYDAFNRLVKRTLDADGAGSGAATNQYWSYDDGINALFQFEGSAASTLSHRYLWANEVDQLLSDEQVTSLSTGGNTLYAHNDHLGTIRDIADFNESTGITTIANHRTYNAYGKLISETNAAVDLLFGYTGKQLDEATGLQHNLNRWYDSGLGQWLNEDPIGFNAGDDNVRRYVGNRILQDKDAFGLSASPIENPLDSAAYKAAMAADLQFLNDQWKIFLAIWEDGEKQRAQGYKQLQIDASTALSIIEEAEQVEAQAGTVETAAALKVATTAFDIEMRTIQVLKNALDAQRDSQMLDIGFAFGEIYADAWKLTQSVLQTWNLNPANNPYFP